MKTKIMILAFLAVLASCRQEAVRGSDENVAAGKLFIIGGGPRPASLVQRMLAESGLSGPGASGPGSILVLSFASGEEDTAIHYASRQFLELGIESVRGMNSTMLGHHEDSVLAALREASLVYLTGGDQSRFMERIEGTGVGEALRQAYQRGATIAGTSAGAAVMSRKMITGDERKHPVYTGDFPTIEAENIELKEGLALDERIIVDQHFIKRQRMNRLLSVALENPQETCLGIDESTAVIIHGNQAVIAGESQVIMIRNRETITRSENGLLGGKNLELSILLPGDSIILE